MNWEKLKTDYTLEDCYNILYRNRPHKNSKSYQQWDYLESMVYEELLIEEERPKECEKIIDEIIEFLKIQKNE